MGAGKSTLGRPLAVALNMPFVDLDDHIEARAGCTIAHIFETQGEACFRQMEVDTVKQVSKPAVVALGGGAFITDEVRAYTRQAGTSIFLDVSFEVLLPRIKGDTSRPLALDESGLKMRYEQRLPIYRQADISFDTTNVGVADCVSLLLERLAL